MAMKPFAGYNFGDYWTHWLDVGARLKSPPAIFHVNWFRQDAAGKFLWPGYGENLRVLKWIIDRCTGTAKAHETAIGHLPHVEDLDTRGLDITANALVELLAVDRTLWRAELEGIAVYFNEFGSRVPLALHTELTEALLRLESTPP